LPTWTDLCCRASRELCSNCLSTLASSPKYTVGRVETYTSSPTYDTVCACCVYAAPVDYVLLSDDNSTINARQQPTTVATTVNNESTTTAALRLVYTEHEATRPWGHEASSLHRARGRTAAVCSVRRLTSAGHRPLRQPTTHHQPTSTQPLTDAKSPAWSATDVLRDWIVDRAVAADSRRRRSTTTLCSCSGRSSRLLLRCVVTVPGSPSDVTKALITVNCMLLLLFQPSLILISAAAAAAAAAWWRWWWWRRRCSVSL